MSVKADYNITTRNDDTNKNAFYVNLTEVAIYERGLRTRGLGNDILGGVPRAPL